MLQAKWYQRYSAKCIKKYKEKKKQFVEIDTAKLSGVKLRKYLHPILRKILHFRNKASGISYQINDCNFQFNKDDTVIYALTHIGKYDFEVFMDACDAFCYPVAGDWELMYGEIDDYFLRINGVLYVDTGDKEDRNNTYRAMVKMLKQGIPILIYPEGIWNLTECLPVMKLYAGAVRAAKEAKVSIIPVAIEQSGKKFVVNIGEEFNVDDDIVVENDRLRDEMATLQWSNWECLPKLQRKDISPNYYETFIKSKLAEWPKYNIGIIKERIYKDKIHEESYLNENSV